MSEKREGASSRRHMEANSGKGVTAARALGVSLLGRRDFSAAYMCFRDGAPERARPQREPRLSVASATRGEQK